MYVMLKMIYNTPQAVENTFAVAKKVPMGDCLCEPYGGFLNNTIDKMSEFSLFNKTACTVSITSPIFC